MAVTVNGNVGLYGPGKIYSYVKLPVVSKTIAKWNQEAVEDFFDEANNSFSLN